MPLMPPCPLPMAHLAPLLVSVAIPQLLSMQVSPPPPVMDSPPAPLLMAPPLLGPPTPPTPLLGLPIQRLMPPSQASDSLAPCTTSPLVSTSAITNRWVSTASLRMSPLQSVNTAQPSLRLS